MTLEELLNDIEASNPGLSEEALLKLEVKVKTIHHSGTYMTTTHPRDVQVHTHWDNVNNKNVGEIVVNCVYTS